MTIKNLDFKEDRTDVFAILVFPVKEYPLGIYSSLTYQILLPAAYPVASRICKKLNIDLTRTAAFAIDMNLHQWYIELRQSCSCDPFCNCKAHAM